MAGSYHVDLDSIAAFLSKLPLFNKFNQTTLKDIIEELTITHLASGEMLLQQGDVADSFYILMHGRLQVFQNTPENEEQYLNDIGPGALVGEIGLLIDSPRTASVYAVRDSVLLKFKKETFRLLLQKYPDVIMDIAKFSLKRLVEKPTPKNTVITIAVLPAGQNTLLPNFSEKLVSELDKLGKTLHLNAASLKKLGAPNLNVATSLERDQLAAWLNQQEEEYRYIVYEADTHFSDWTQRCIRQADRILLVGLAQEKPNYNEIEAEFFTEKYEHFHLLTEFVLLHANSAKATHTENWLKLRPLHNYYHVGAEYEADYAKLVRFLTGHATSLVLCGGGARSLAHIGVLRALEDLNIKIDMIGGVSMGAWVGAGFALGLNSYGILDFMKEAFTYYSKKKDYTFPFVSVFKGKVFEHVLKQSIGEHTRIENLWNRYFCLSTNLNKGQMHIHDRGLLWRSIQASSSLPAIYPPVVKDEKELLVDGGVINNLPVDVMRTFINGGKVIASSVGAEISKEENFPADLSSGWRLFLERSKFLAKGLSLPTLTKVVAASMTLGAHSHQREMSKAADYSFSLDMNNFGLLEFKAYQQIVDQAYRLALQQLTKKPYHTI